MRRPLRLLLAVVLLAATAMARAQSTAPQPRVLTDSHAGAVLQLAVSAEAGITVSVGEDKTLRIWRTSDLRPIRTIALPSDPSREGVPNALAVTRDGKTAFVGGFTGVTWRPGATVYKVDTASGRLSAFLQEQPGEIHALAVSADGAQLAVGLTHALRVVDTATGASIREDREYDQRIDSVDFSVDGDLAATSSDGCLRIYRRPGLALVFRQQYPPAPTTGSASAAPGRACKGGQLGDVHFSPDGSRLAFGVQDVPDAVIMDARSLAPISILRTSDPAQYSLCCMAWSADGSRLNVHGQTAGNDQDSALYQADGSGKTAATRLALTGQRIMDMAGLPGGDFMVATDNSALVRIDAAGNIKASTSSGRTHTSVADKLLLVSNDARTVAFGSAVEPYRFRLDDPVRRSLSKPTRDALATLQAPLRSGAANVKAGRLGPFEQDDAVTINGQPSPMIPHELLWSWATHATQPLAALGTGWFLRLSDAEGTSRWARYVVSPVQAVSISDDARWVVAALGDGTVHWYAAASGDEHLALYVDPVHGEWVAWRPDGYYMSSPKGDALFGWVLNRGDGQAADMVRAVQLERTLYRPDLVRRALNDGEVVETTSVTLASNLKALAAPRVAIESLNATDDGLELSFSAESTGVPMESVNVYVGGLPVLRADQRPLRGVQKDKLGMKVRLPLVVDDPVVRVEVETSAALGVDETRLVQRVAARSPVRGRLWILAIGVESFDFAPEVEKLPFATNDAREIAATFVALQGHAFSDVQAVVLAKGAGQAPTKANVMAGLRALGAMKPEDTLLVFLASHGTTDAAEYYFLTKDASAGDLKRLADSQLNHARLVPGSVPSLLSGTELTLALRQLPGRRILMLDTCQAGAVGDADPYSLVKRSASTQVAVVSAASGDESSYDSPTQPHGAFTQAVIDALKASAVTRGDAVTLKEMFQGAEPRLQETISILRGSARSASTKASIRQTPILAATDVLQATVLMTK